MHNKLKIGTTDETTCSSADMTGQHLLQDCPEYKKAKKTELCGDTDSLMQTAAFFKDIWFNTWEYLKQKKKDFSAAEASKLLKHGCHVRLGIDSRGLAENLYGSQKWASQQVTGIKQVLHY